MTFAEYVSLLRRSAGAIAAFIVLGAAAGYGYAALSTPVYRAQTSTLVTTDVGGSASELLQGSTYAESLVASYVRLVTSQSVLATVMEEEDVELSPRQFAQRVTAESPLNTLFIDIAVVDEDPARAARLANAVTDSLADTVQEVSPQIDGEPSIRLTTVENASEPRFQFAPNPRLLAAGGAAVGLALGVGLALLRHLRGSSLKSAPEVARFTEIPVVGQVVEARKDTRLSAAVIEHPMGPEAESVRALVANLQFISVTDGLRSLTITSASPAESKSSVASTLALVLTEASQKVLLIDADLRAPSLHDVTNLDNSLGLSSVLVGEATLGLAAQSWGPHGKLDVLTSGPLPPNPAQLLRTEAMEKLLSQAEADYDVVVIDTPPVGSVVDAVWTGRLSSGALLVARRGRTKPRAMTRALEALEGGNVQVLGIVMTRMKRSANGYGYGYGKHRSRRGLSQSR